MTIITGTQGFYAAEPMSQSLTWLILYSDKSCPDTMYRTGQRESPKGNFIHENRLVGCSAYIKTKMFDCQHISFFSKRLKHQD